MTIRWRSSLVLAIVSAAAWTIAIHGAEPLKQLPLHLSWGHTSPAHSSFYVRLVGEKVAILDGKGAALEADNEFRDGAWQTHSGGGDVDGVQVILRYPDVPVEDRQGLNPIWRDLLGQSDPDTARRLRLDPGYRSDPRKLTVHRKPVTPSTRPGGRTWEVRRT